MKKALFACVVVLAGTAAIAQTNISIGINQPGVYGRINIGEVPRPALVYAQPVVITQPPVHIDRRPIYMYVPVAHQSDWRRYCGRYGACGQPVYFVQDQWVRERYNHEHPGWDRGRKHGRDRDRDDHGRGHNKHDRHDNGHGKGHGKGHGHKD